MKKRKPKYETQKLKGKTKLLQSRNFNKFGFDFHPQVSLISGGFVILFLMYTLKDPEQANANFTAIKNVVTTNWNWFFILSANFFLIFPIYLMFSKLGEVRLGGPEAKPEFTNFAWYSMLMSAGMGIGLLFWGVGEPLFHYNSTLPMFGKQYFLNGAMGITYFHWGLHGWGVYALIALALAFFAYNRGLPLSLRSVFYPILKDKVFGIIGDIIDILAVISCLFGLATSLGFGSKQINAGLNYLFGVPISVNIQVLIICIITGFATLSVISGIGKGVRILSELNIRVAGLFLLFVLIAGPTIFLFRLLPNSVGFYIANLVDVSFWTEQGKGSWQGSWTIFYWAWWISWSPFVGMFIARISKGRTVREFVTAILLVPTILCILWINVFGGTAISQAMSDGGEILGAVNTDLSTALFVMIRNMDIPAFAQTGLCLLGTFLVISFFVTSSDSGSLVVDNLTSGGKLDSPVPQRVFWAVMEGTVAATLLVAGGSNALNALQTAVIVSGLPFAFILLVMSYSLNIGLQKDLKKLKQYKEDKLLNEIFNEKIHGEFEKDEKIKQRMY